MEFLAKASGSGWMVGPLGSDPTLGNFGFDSDFLAMPYLKSIVALVLLRVDRVMWVS